MSVSFSARIVVFLLWLLRAHSVRAQSFPPDFELPEIDGSAVDETCRIFVVDPSEDTPTTTTTRPETTASPVPTKPVVTTTEKPIVRSSPQKPVTRAPIRTQPAAGGPITTRHTDAELRLLYYLLTNSRGRVGSSQPMGGLDVTSSSEELAANWKTGALSLEDSSDES